MSTLQRITGGGWACIGVDDASARQTIAASSLGVDEQGGSPGTLPARVPPTFVASFDRLVGAGWWPIGTAESAFNQKIAADSVGIDENGKAETHSSSETLAYPKIIFY